MEWLQIVVLALVQGVTEFLPVSSSGHLVLVSALTGWPDQGLGMHVALHAGTLLAVLLYVRADSLGLVRGALGLVRGRVTGEARLLLLLALATLPLVAAGLLAQVLIMAHARAVGVIAATTLLFGALLLVADRRAGTRTVADVTIAHALVIGGAQTLALIPGTSRSGITLTAACLLGYRRDEAARLALLLSIPAIVGAATLLLAGGLTVGMSIQVVEMITAAAWPSGPPMPRSGA